MKIKPCPFCGSENVQYSSLAGRVFCEDCQAHGPCGATDEDAIRKWNAAPRKKDMKMEKCCQNCVHISKEVDGKVYCTEELDEDYSCKYWAQANPFESDPRLCWNCKYNYVDDECAMYCGRAIGNPEGYVCDSWEAKESKSTLLNTENPSGKPFIDLARDELDVIQTLETKVNEYLMAAEEAAEMAQAMLKYCRACGHGSWTPINPKDATDAVIEEYADLLLAMEASFPRHEGNKMFYNNLERVYKEKAKRWAERLKEAKEK